MQSSYDSKGNAARPTGLHVAIIMDGNGRWATARGLPRGRGHEVGVETIRPIIETAPSHGVGTLTVFAFSSDNWRRPKAEVAGLMHLLRHYFDREANALADGDVRLSVIGRRDRLPGALRRQIARVESITAQKKGLHFRIALDYSGRAAILEAAARLADGANSSPEFFGQLLAGKSPTPDVDLLIRTGGEQRLSDFLLWESAYAELYFTPKMWPDFGTDDFAEAVRSFRRRERRFGGLSPHPAAA